MTAPVTDIEWLEGWYQRNCNGDWEHTFGVKIETLDNPGWSVVIDLDETYLEGVPFDDVVDLDSGADWIHCTVDGTKWIGSAGPRGLGAILQVFRAWADENCPDAFLSGVDT
jgi:hypothetical protein